MGGACLRRPRTQISSPRARRQSSLHRSLSPASSPLSPPSRPTRLSATRLPTARRPVLPLATTVAKRVTSRATAPPRRRRRPVISAAKRVTSLESARRTPTPPRETSPLSTAVATLARSATAAVNYTCGGVGHLSRDCVQGSKCYNCSGFGHISKDCPQPQRRACYSCGSEG
ncbi:hypothetical protein BV20DRAFT_153462 [Pilatotrama ljubarskyi]|nr:hypothetical protein BV20DRAFT_153462 [Pilatotrama ljubarskyi]